MLRQGDLRARIDDLRACTEATGNDLPGWCQSDRTGEAELMAMLQQDANYADHAAEMKPWGIPRIERILEVLDVAEEGVRNEHTKFHHTLVRRARFRENVEDFE